MKKKKRGVLAVAASPSPTPSPKPETRQPSLSSGGPLRLKADDHDCESFANVDPQDSRNIGKNSNKSP